LQNASKDKSFYNLRSEKNYKQVIMSTSYPLLYSTYPLGTLTLKNRIVMSPMTRSRAIGNIPNDIMAKYYGDRAAAGLIITEGTAPSPDGLGYARIPGLFNKAQVEGWKKVTAAVHEKGGKIFVQLMHTGRISHPHNLPDEGVVRGASAIAAAETQMYTDKAGMQSLPVPKEISTDEIPALIEEFVQSAKYAVEAGFDGIELHGANGYLLEQFLNPASNHRKDEYGGTPANRNRFVLDVAKAVANAIGKDKTGIRLSPFGAAGEMKSDEHTEQQYAQLAAGLKQIGIVYLHVVDHSSIGAPVVPQSVKDAIRNAFGATIILAGGFDASRGEVELKEGKGDLIAFGRPFLSNPDFVKRIRQGAELNQPDFNTFYTPGEKGYNDYPVLTGA
jgi:N-ethylmaleimide reductase